ncbi:hypothetical protein CHUUTOTORO_00900 [Serratia phage vB_SmaM-ChuuTotoro]|nr:hypothetical protein CHUUTOTORO_00900 [Serratia phage vB_SmaM-ChuuTotoro]
MIFENADVEIISLVEAEDKLRHHVRQYKGATMVHTGPWTIVDDPWSIQWLNDKEELCQVQIIAPPIEGEKLSMFVVTFDAQTVINLILFKEEYISVENELEKADRENPDD